MFSIRSLIRPLTGFRRQRQPAQTPAHQPVAVASPAGNSGTTGIADAQVELAVRRAIRPGMRLHTPGMGYPPRNQRQFAVTAVDEIGINTDKTMGHYITWPELAGVVPYLQSLGGGAPIGARETQPDPDTLGHYLHQLGSRPSPRKVSYLVPVLEAAGVLEYDHNNGKAKRIRLLPPFKAQN